jgi:hypothetical protein
MKKKGTGGIILPQQTNRFRVLFGNFGNSTEEISPLTVNIQSVDLPQFGIVPKWSNFSISVRSGSEGLVAKEIGNQLSKDSDNNKFTVIVECLDKTAEEVITTYTMQDCTIVGAYFDEFDYRKDGISNQVIILEISTKEVVIS